MIKIIGAFWYFLIKPLLFAEMFGNVPLKVFGVDLLPFSPSAAPSTNPVSGKIAILKKPFPAAKVWLSEIVAAAANVVTASFAGNLAIERKSSTGQAKIFIGETPGTFSAFAHKILNYRLQLYLYSS